MGFIATILPGRSSSRLQLPPDLACRQPPGSLTAQAALLPERYLRRMEIADDQAGKQALLAWSAVRTASTKSCSRSSFAAAALHAGRQAGVAVPRALTSSSVTLERMKTKLSNMWTVRLRKQAMDAVGGTCKLLSLHRVEELSEEGRISFLEIFCLL